MSSTESFKRWNVRTLERFFIVRASLQQRNKQAPQLRLEVDLENRKIRVADLISGCALGFGRRSEGGGQKLADRFGIEVLSQIPLSPPEYGGTFESYTKIIQTIAEMDQKSANQVGRLV